MKRVSYQQFAIVQADSAQQLTEQLNQKLYELREENPTVTFEGLIARISYYVTEEVEKKNSLDTTQFKFKCKDCPMFEPVLKRDGTADRRMTIGRCPFANEGHTLTYSNACERLYEMIKDREVKLCLRED